MKKTSGAEPGSDSRQLRTLERWRALELENAQTNYAALMKTTLEKQSAHERISSDIEAVQEFARDSLHGALSVESLQRLTAFAALQAQQLAEAQAEVEQSQARSDQAHDVLVEHVERLSVVERLRERRVKEGMKVAAREDQKLLDEHALARRSGGESSDTLSKE